MGSGVCLLLYRRTRAAGGLVALLACRRRPFERPSEASEVTLVSAVYRSFAVVAVVGVGGMQLLGVRRWCRLYVL